MMLIILYSIVFLPKDISILQYLDDIVITSSDKESIV